MRSAPLCHKFRKKRSKNDPTPVYSWFVKGETRFNLRLPSLGDRRPTRLDAIPVVYANLAQFGASKQFTIFGGRLKESYDTFTIEDVKRYMDHLLTIATEEFSDDVHQSGTEGLPS